MIYLKIDSNKGYYRIDDLEKNWIELDLINKDHLLKLLAIATEKDFEMEEYDDESLKNPAHNIIYKNIHAKFLELLNNKTRFKDSVSAMYKSAIDKYSLEVKVAD